MWNALEPEVKEEKILGGLFKHITMERKVKTSEPKPRELWSRTIKDDKLECEKIEDIKNKTISNSNWYNNNQGYHGGYGGGGCGYRSAFDKEKKEEEGGVLVEQAVPKPKEKKGGVPKRGDTQKHPKNQLPKRLKRGRREKKL